jgi:hypothetical protein
MTLGCPTEIEDSYISIKICKVMRAKGKAAKYTLTAAFSAP